jgi:hypothetical protein
MPETVPVVTTTKKGERVIIDPEASTERAMLWFYLLINIGGFMGTFREYQFLHKNMLIVLHRCCHRLLREVHRLVVGFPHSSHPLPSSAPPSLVP